MIYKSTIHLRNGVPIDVHTKELPTFSEENGLLQFEKPNGEFVTFVLDAVAYFSTKAGA